jgi:hypothetical protein
MKKFNFRRTILRNGFTEIFGGVGNRRTIFINKDGKPSHYKRTHMQMYRRASQGWRNQIYGRLCALKLYVRFGKRKPSRRFGL